MKVLHLIHNLEIGGAQVILKTLIAAQLAEGIEPVIAVWKRTGPLEDELELDASQIHICPNGTGAVGTYRWLLRVLNEARPTIIHAHMPDSAFWAGVLSRRTALPSLISYYSNNILFHTIEPKSLYGRFRWRLIEWASRIAGANVACADTVQHKVAERLGFTLQEVDVVPNGIATPSDDEVANKMLDDSVFHVVTVGRLEHIKGQYQLIECASLLRNKIPNVKVTIVGEGPRIGEWQQKIHDLDLADFVILTDRVPDPTLYLSQAHAYVSTSHYEGSSMSLLEAMSWRVPVVATEVHGNTDVIRHGENGLFYELDDLEQLVDRIQKVVEDPISAKRRADYARKLVMERFSASAMHRGYLEIYRRLNVQAVQTKT